MLCVAALATTVAGAADGRDGVHNGSFELGLHPQEHRPNHWHIGFPGEEDPMPGTWALTADGVAGSIALTVTCTAVDATCVVAQIADLPAAVMAGEELVLSLRVATAGAGGWAGAQVAAVNPEVEVDPQTGIPHVGFLQLATDQPGWTTLHGSLTLEGPAAFIAVVLFVVGDGVAARFDEVSLETALAPPDCGPWPHDVAALEDGPPGFPVGITNENPRNGSDHALADLVARGAEVGRLINLFAHVRWNALTGSALLDGHERVLAASRLARSHGLRRMLTLDFTHAALEGLGDINPLPDGTPVERLDAETRSAYVAELRALVDAVDPEIVSVGIETDFFWDAHPDQWSDFRTMLCDAADGLRQEHPGIHVTTYFTLPTLVHADLSLDDAGVDALQALRPCIDSVGYSYYPADGTTHVDDIPAGMFTAARAVAPELPLIVPELGYRSDPPYSEEEQETFLRRALDELGGDTVTAVVLYSLYDQSYLGAPEWFKEAFGHIGVLDVGGVPKRAFVLLTRSRDGPPPVVWPRLSCSRTPRSTSGRAQEKP